MKKKGFTLVEVLAVIVIVGILLVIAIPQVLSMIKRGTRSYYHGIENDMKVAGVDYMETYRTLLPREIGNTSVVTLEELINSDYIDEVKDEKGNTCTGKVAIVKAKKNSYKYYSCLICGDYYESSENDCSYDEYNNKYADAADYSIATHSDIYEVGQGKDFTSPLARVYYKGQLIKDDLKGRPVKIDTNKIGTYDLIFYYHGAMKKVDIKVKDETDPEKTSVVLRLDNKDGKSYKSNWYNGNVYAEYKASDYTKKGISGSGIDYYEVSEDKETWTKVEGNSEIIEKEGNYLRYVRAVDKDGNTGKVKEYRIKLDRTKPTCSLEVKSGTPYTNLINVLWYNTDITVGYKETDGTYSNVMKKPITYTMNNKETKDNDLVTVNKPIEGLVITGTLTDEAGNKNTCKITVNVDNVAPKLTAGAETAVQDVATNRARDYFTQTYSVSKEDSLVCKLMTPDGETVTDTVIDKVSELGLGKNYVTCTVTGGSGLQHTTKTLFRHWYYANVLCSGGRYVNDYNHNNGAGNCKMNYYNDIGRCGCAYYYEARSSACGVESYNSCATAGCGIAGYNTCSTPACGEIRENRQSCRSCHTTVGSISACNAMGGTASKDGSGNIECDYQCCSTYSALVGYKSCSNPACGAIYNTCQNSACGVAQWRSCRDSSHGCERGNDCTIVENNYRSYNCHITGTTNVTGNGSISGNRCSF